MATASGGYPVSGVMKGLGNHPPNGLAGIRSQKFGRRKPGSARSSRSALNVPNAVAGLSEPSALEKLSAEERKEWLALWRETEALLDQTARRRKGHGEAVRQRPDARSHRAVACFGMIDR